MEDSKAAKSRRTSSRHCWRSSEDFLPEEGCSSSAPGASALVLSGGGVAGAFAGGRREMEGFSRRFVMRLKGFSSTLSRRRLWRASVAEESQYEAESARGRKRTFAGLVEELKRRCHSFVVSKVGWWLGESLCPILGEVTKRRHLWAREPGAIGGTSVDL